MGVNNSSQYRVSPMMRYMMKDMTRLEEMLSLVDVSIQNEKTEIVRFGSEKEGDPGEMSLRPSCDYLCKLIECFPNNTYAQEKIKKNNSPKTMHNRLNMIEDSANREAIEFIRSNYSDYAPLHKNYRILEGDSCPDVFIETDKKVIVIEGKWTETHITEKTDYQENRNQMVRHIHNAIYYVNSKEIDKEICGFYIVAQSFGINANLNLSHFGIKR